MFLYGIILATMGLTISWAAPACNNPVFAEVRKISFKVWVRVHVCDHPAREQLLPLVLSLAHCQVPSPSQ